MARRAQHKRHFAPSYKCFTQVNGALIKLLYQREKFGVIHFWSVSRSINRIVSRQSISFTTPNDEWSRANDLISQARKQQVQIDWILA